MTYTTESWRVPLTPLCDAAGIPIAFALKWIDVESGGNPCAVGNPAASYDGVHPREAGISQWYGPDDYQATGVDPSAVRAYCVPKGPHGFSQQCSRPLTADEVAQQARGHVALIQHLRKRADGLLAAVGATWTGADYWRFVKLQHGIPGLANAIRLVMVNLGRPPATWAEFAHTVTTPAVLTVMSHSDRGTYAYASSFAKVLANAEKTGGVVA